ncbi:MAG: family 43 glycosylhydrolase [Fibrobacteres bacterium]|nr:family 43 glycosylhydrolase [Fibrobacterota bacterium]
MPTDKANNIRNVRYAPPGEYVKDHCFIKENGIWHLFGISGGIGKSWEDKGHEERISHSTSSNLIHWQLIGHPVEASRQPGFYDEHMAVAPFIVRNHDGLFYMFYSGWRHPNKRPNFSWEGNLQSIYVAVSSNLNEWEIPKEIKPKGIIVDGEPIVGRDPHVLWDAERKRWLLYFTDATTKRGGIVGIAESSDLLHWRNLGRALTIKSSSAPYDPAESPFVIRHPNSGKYLMLLNWDYSESDDPVKFEVTRPLPFKCGIERTADGDIGIGAGFAREIISHEGQQYLSGVLGKFGQFVIGFTPFSWTDRFLTLD